MLGQGDDFMACSCSAATETPQHVVTKRRLNKAECLCVMTELLCCDLIHILVAVVIAGEGGVLPLV